MTALYAILAIICIGGILIGAYLIGFADGVTAEQMRRSLYSISNEDTAEEDSGNDRHALTHADLAQMEQEAKNKNEV